MSTRTMAWLFARGVILLSLSMVALFSLGLVFDLSAAGVSPWQLTAFDAVQARHLNNMLNRNLNQLVGVAFTMVAIAVPLTANLYSLKFLEFFVKDPINAAVLIFVAFVNMFNTWAGYSISEGHVPRLELHLAFWGTLICFAVLFPYLYYVFRFLHPNTLIDRLADECIGVMKTASRRPDWGRGKLALGIENLANIAVRAVERNDRNTTLDVLVALERVDKAYATHKNGLPPAWFKAEQDFFLGLSSRAVEELTASRSWVEMKVFAQLLQIFSAASPKMPEITAACAKSLRKLALQPAALADPVTRELALDYFNTLIRLCLNRRDLRAMLSVFEQYRLLAAGLHQLAPAEVLLIARYFEYYARLAREQNLLFAVEIIAYDLGALVESAWQAGLPQREALLERFVAFDRHAPRPLGGVKKAQAILASAFLLQGQTEPVATLRRAFAGLSEDFIHAVRDELLSVTREKFWEVNERRLNVDYVPPAQRARLVEFFASLP